MRTYTRDEKSDRPMKAVSSRDLIVGTQQIDFIAGNGPLQQNACMLALSAGKKRQLGSPVTLKNFERGS